MNKIELITKLILKGINEKYYSLGEEIKENAYNIELLPNGRYAVYYMERGEKSELKEFSNEEDANQNLFTRIVFNVENGLDLS